MQYIIKKKKKHYSTFMYELNFFSNPNVTNDIQTHLINLNFFMTFIFYFYQLTVSFEIDLDV